MANASPLLPIINYGIIALDGMYQLPEDRARVVQYDAQPASSSCALGQH